MKKLIILFSCLWSLTVWALGETSPTPSPTPSPSPEGRCLSDETREFSTAASCAEGCRDLALLAAEEPSTAHCVRHGRFWDCYWPGCEDVIIMLPPDRRRRRSSRHGESHKESVTEKSDSNASVGAE